MADSKAASCLCAFNSCDAGVADGADGEEAAGLTGAEVPAGWGAGGLVIRFSTVLEADVFFFSAMSASHLWRTGQRLAFIPDGTGPAQLEPGGRGAVSPTTAAAFIQADLGETARAVIVQIRVARWRRVRDMKVADQAALSFQ
jgi:hypothetical protein